MMKKFAILFYFAILVFHSKAQYITPGTGIVWDMDDLVTNSAGSVTLENGIYYITDDLVISAYDTLRIISDATIGIFNEKQITVQGTWQAYPPFHLLITANDTLQHYKGFRFEYSNASFFENCTIEFGGGIELIESNVRFEDCVIRKNNKSNSTGAIDLFSSNPQVINCEIYNNEGPAILSPANGDCSPFIYGNWIYRNNTANTNMPQINLGTSDPETDIQILNNEIDGFYDKVGGIAISTLAGGSISCVIDGNEIKNNRYGITAYGFNINSIISNNTIADNDIENLPMQGGSGINFWGDESNTSLVFGNEIRGNLWGITVQNAALPNMGKVEPDTICEGENLIFENGNEGQIYGLYNNTPNNLYAENNFWGTYDPDSVEMAVYHQPDNPGLGFVDYLPIKDYVTNSWEIKENNAIQFQIYPNPASESIRISHSNETTKRFIGKLEIIDFSGHMIQSIRFEQFPFDLDISSWNSGLYTLRLIIGKDIFTKVLIKN
jgi:hypothetical protein